MQAISEAKSTPTSKSRSISSNSLRCAIALAIVIGPAAKAEVTFEYTVSDFEGGISVPSSHTFSAREKVFLNVRIVGLPRPEPPVVQELAFRVEALDPTGRLLAPAHDGKLAIDWEGKDPEWNPFFRSQLEIPPTPLDGDHKFRVTLRTAEAPELAGETIFHVKAPYGPPPAGLALQDFQFFRSERETQPLSPVVFRGGEAIWCRFVLAGFKTGPGNVYDVRTGLSLLNSAGRVLFSEPKAAADSKTSFYPRTHVQGVFSVRLESSVRPGTYKLLVTTTDAIGKQQIKTEHTFEVQ